MSRYARLYGVLRDHIAMKSPVSRIVFQSVGAVAALYAAHGVFGQGLTSNTTTSNATVGSRPPSIVAPPVTSKMADDEWQLLSTASVPKSRVSVGLLNTAQRAAARDTEAKRLQDLAKQAKDFYTKNPTDPRNAQARKIEVKAALASVGTGNKSMEQDALTRAAAYRVNVANLREDRFEVAVEMEMLKLRSRGSKGRSSLESEKEKIADGFRGEFGDIPEVVGFYTGIAAKADMHTANRIATKLLEMRLSSHMKAEVEAITSRYGLVGRPLFLRLTKAGGEKFELPGATPAPSPTVIYVWAAGKTPPADPFAALAEHKGKIARDTRWIYLSFATAPAQLAEAARKVPFPGTLCVEAEGSRSAVAERLKVRSVPMVFVINRQGVLTGYGRPDELPALLSSASK